MKLKIMTIAAILIANVLGCFASTRTLYYYPIILSCGQIHDYYSVKILNDDELLEIVDQLEKDICGNGETPGNPSIDTDLNP